MPVDISSIINIQGKANNNLNANNNMEPRETIPTLNLYQPVKNSSFFDTNKQEKNILLLLFHLHLISFEEIYYLLDL